MKKTTFGFVGSTLVLCAGMFNSSLAQSLSSNSRLTKALQYVEESEYDIRDIGDAGTFKAANREQNLRFTLNGNMMAVEERDYGKGKARPWEVLFEFDGASKGGQPLRAVNPRWALNKKEARLADDNVTIEYKNQQDGLRQSFWIMKRPAGNDLLQLKFSLFVTRLGFKVNPTSVEFSNEGGTNVLIYKDLNVWDSRGSQLEASMIPVPGNHFAIVVNDESAEYPILVDPLSSKGAWTQSGQSSATFGYSVAETAEEGYPGFVVGAPSFDTASLVDAGKVFAFIGLDNLPSTPVWTKEGDQAHGGFGYSVAGRGDFDGDGNSDVAVGAWQYSSGGYSGNGKVWVFAGNGVNGPGSTAIWSYAPSQSSAEFGLSIGWLPDIDGDGTQELAVGAPTYSNGGISGGAVFVYYGGSTPNTTADWTAYGSSASAYFGYSVARADNAEGDGNSALVVGAPGSGSPGAVHIYYGTGSALGNSPTIINGQNNGDSFGNCVSGGFDQNGDGYSDILVGAPKFSNGQNQEGKAYLFRGSSSGISTTASWTVESNQAGAWLGYALAGGDIDNDGKGDLLVCAPFYSTTFLSLSGNGEGWFYLTDSSDSPVLDTRILGLHNNDNNGLSACFANHRYFRGWVVGAPYAHGSGGTDGGTVTAWEYVSP